MKTEICKVLVKAGATPPLLHSVMNVDTKKYSKMRFEMKISEGNPYWRWAGGAQTHELEGR